MTKNYDIVIAGAGVIGASCAYYLSRHRDLSIALIDSKRPGNASWASAGGLWAIGESVGLGCGVIFFRRGAADHEPNAAAHLLPRSFLDFAMASNALYPALHAELKEGYGTDFKFEESGLKFVMYDDADMRYAQAIADAVPHLREQMRWLDADELRACEPNISREATGALEFLCDHQVSPFRLAGSYMEAARQNGVTLYQNTNITAVRRNGSRVTGVDTREHGLLGCSTLINAAGAWAADLSEWATGFRIPVRPVKGQIVLSERLPKMLRGCVSTSDCYIAQKDNGEILIGSTTEERGYDVSTTINEIRGLVKGALRCIPELKQTHIKRCWAGLRPGTPDELPILGAMPGVDGYLNACGHFRTGILTSAITGVAIDRLVRHAPLPVEIKPFSVERFL